MSQNLTQRLFILTHILLKIAAGKSAFLKSDLADSNDVDLLFRLIIDSLEQLRLSSHEFGNDICTLTPPLLHFTFLLDSQFIVKAYIGEGSINTLEQNIIGLPFKAFIELESIDAWRKTCEQQDYIPTIFQLRLKLGTVANSYLCSLTTFREDEMHLLIAISNNLVFTGNISKNFDCETEGHHLVDKVKQLHDYILSHLIEPLPSTKTLAKMLVTNEFYLKVAFKNLYGSSIYRYYNKCRLEHAYLLITQTNMSLLEVSESCGFGSYTTFSKAFGKLFGITPKALRRRNV